jgi:hypothetical protein
MPAVRSDMSRSTPAVDSIIPRMLSCCVDSCRGATTGDGISRRMRTRARGGEKGGS